MPTPTPKLKSTNAAANALVGIWTIALSAFIVIPLLTLGLFVVLELLSNNVIEPWLYGASTGVSPIALIFSAVCWTWLWGPVGLVLATPRTVCLVVMGRHIPRLSFLSVLLSDEEAQGIEAQSTATKLGVGELIGMVEKAAVDVVCISVVAPSTVLHARYLCLKLQAHLPKQRILVGLWGATENLTEVTRRLRDSGADEVVTTLADAVRHIAQLGRPQVEEPTR